MSNFESSDVLLESDQRHAWGLGLGSMTVALCYLRYYNCPEKHTPTARQLILWMFQTSGFILPMYELMLTLCKASASCSQSQPPYSSACCEPIAM